MGRPILKGATSQSTIIWIIDATTGLPETGVTFETAGLALWYRRLNGAVVAITEKTQTPDGAYDAGGFCHLSDGAYRLDPPDAACDVGAGVDEFEVGGTVTGMIVIGNSHPLVNYNPYDGVRMGMTALPAAAADAAGGLPISDDGGLDLDNILEKIGTPVALDGAAATLGAMLAKLADDNGGADFDAETDSLEKIRGDLASAADVNTAVENGAVGTAAAAIQAVTDEIPDAGALTDIIADLAGLGELVGALPDTAAVNAQVVDVLKTDTLGEPAQGAPPVTASIEAKIAWLYKFLRNKVTDDGSTIEVFNDVGAVVDHKAPVSESEGTVTRGEFVSGP